MRPLLLVNLAIRTNYCFKEVLNQFSRRLCNVSEQMCEF